MAVEGKLGTAEAVVAKLGVDAKENDDLLDAKLRVALDTVTSRLGDELRAKSARTQEAFNALKGVALGAVEAARNMAGLPTAPPGLPSLAAFEAALTILDGRTTAISASVQSLTADFAMCSAQVADLVSAVGAFQNVTPRSAQQLCCLRVRALRTRLQEQLVALRVIWAAPDGRWEA